MPRQQATSFHIKSVPVSGFGGAYKHHKPEHRDTLNYVLHERTQLNESWHKEYQANGHHKTLKNYHSDTKKIIKKKTGRSLQKQAEDNVIGESVVVIDEHTTMEDLQRLGKALEQEFGWTCVQIHIHRDEGYHRNDTRLNLHAHMFFITTNLETGLSYKRKVGDGSLMQDITARELNLTRGEPKQVTKAKHLDAIEYKEEQAKKNLEVATQENETIGKEIEQAKLELEQVKTAKEIRQEEAKKALEGVVGAVTGAMQGVGRKAEEARRTLKEHEERREEIEEGKSIIERANALKSKNKPQIEEIKKEHTKKSFLGGEKVDLEAVLEDYVERAETRAYRLEGELKREREESKREIGSLRWQLEQANETIRNWQREKKKWDDEKERIAITLGDKFQALYDECKKYFKGMVDNLSLAVGMWIGYKYNNRKEGSSREEYSADRIKGKLLINNETIEEREERKQQQQKPKGRGFRM